MTDEQIALEATLDLFRNGNGDEASRLVLTSADGRNLGGWGRSSVKFRILAALKRRASAPSSLVPQVPEPPPEGQPYVCGFTLPPAEPASGQPLLEVIPQDEDGDCVVSIKGVPGWHLSGHGPDAKAAMVCLAHHIVSADELEREPAPSAPSAQEAGPSVPGDVAKLAKNLESYVVAMGAMHEDHCPGDDTCDCVWKPANDAANEACNYFAALAASSPQQEKK